MRGARSVPPTAARTTGTPKATPPTPSRGGRLGCWGLPRRLERRPAPADVGPGGRGVPRSPSSAWAAFRSRFLAACADRRVACVSTGATKAVGSPGELLAFGGYFPAITYPRGL